MRQAAIVQDIRRKRGYARSDLTGSAGERREYSREYHGADENLQSPVTFFGVVTLNQDKQAHPSTAYRGLGTRNLWPLVFGCHPSMAQLSVRPLQIFSFPFVSETRLLSCVLRKYQQHTFG